MTAEQQQQEEAPQVVTAESALEGLFSAEYEVAEDQISVTSNSGDTVSVDATEPMAIGDVLAQSGISPDKGTQVIVDGAPVADDHIVSPGTEVYLHRVVQGG